MSKDKWASLIEACEMGSESGAETVLRYLQERDELLAALKQIEKHLDPDGFCDSKAVTFAFQWARHAIAKCKEPTDMEAWAAHVHLDH